MLSTLLGPYEADIDVMSHMHRGAMLWFALLSLALVPPLPLFSSLPFFVLVLVALYFPLPRHPPPSTHIGCSFVNAANHTYLHGSCSRTALSLGNFPTMHAEAYICTRTM